MTLEVQIIPAKMPAGSLIACLLDKKTLYFKGLPRESLDLAANYQKEIRDKKTTESLLLTLPDKKDPTFLFFAALESVKYFNRNETVKILAFQALQKLRNLGRTRLFFPVDTKEAVDMVPLLAEGVLLGGYRFDRYLSRNEKTSGKDETIVFLCDPSDKSRIQKFINHAVPLFESVNHAREIINEPADVVTPEVLAQRARSLAKRYNLRCRVLDEKQLKKQGYNGLLTVGSGSPHPPRLIVLEYNPVKQVKNRHLCIVGKGITFDTGGICLKTSKHMWEMKTDMAGAAAVLHSIEAAVRLSIPIKMTAVVPTAENIIGPKANLPGYIFRAKNNKSIHVINTDAEGRLILTDALAMAQDLSPTHLIDLATLTGSCVSALGHSLSGLFGDDPAFNKLFLDLAEKAGEPCWELPLYEEYRKQLSCDFADINNMGDITDGGAIHGALFLSEFKPAGIPWIHLDIAGTAMMDKEWKYFRAGATGVGIRTITLLARHLAGE
jgi:leucyl aminopeptidase